MVLRLLRQGLDCLSATKFEKVCSGLRRVPALEKLDVNMNNVLRKSAEARPNTTII